MAELEHPQIFFPDDPLGAPNMSQPQSNGRNTPAGGGHNADEAIMIGSSDEEDEDPAPPRRPTPAGSLLERMNRLHGNRRGEYFHTFIGSVLHLFVGPRLHTCPLLLFYLDPNHQAY